MATRESLVLTGYIVEERETFTVEQLSQLCAVERQCIVELAAEGILEPQSPGAAQFSGASLGRARLALRLQRDFGVNTAGLALVIDLLERIEILERRTRQPVR